MRIAVISDLHANLQAWRAALRDLVEAGADSIVCLGDVVGYGPEPRAVLDGLREATDNIVMGNHEAAVAGRMDLSEFSDPARRLIEWTRAHLDDETVRFLGALPPGIAGHGALFVHAEAADPMRFQYIEDAASARANLEDRAERLVFTGHTHLPGVFVMDPAGGDVVHGAPSLLRLRPGMRYLVNVGSVGEPRDLDPRGAYALFDDEQGTVEFRRFEFDIAGYRHALARTGLDYEPFFLATHRRREFLARAGAAETGPSAAAAGIAMAPRALAASRILRPVKGAPAPATAPLQAGTKIISLPPDMPGTSRKAIHAGRRLRSRRALTRAAMGLLFLGLSGLALWEYRRHTTPAASHPDEDAESRAMGTENRSTEDTTPSDQPQPVGQQNVIYTPQKMVETRTLGTGTEMMTMTGKTAGTEMQAAPVPASPQPAPAPTTTVTASLSPAPLPLPPAASLSPAMDGEPAGGGRSLSLATAGEDADRFGLQATLGQSLTNSEFRAHEQAPSPGPVMPTLSRPPSYKLARSSASRMPSGTNRSTGGMQAMGGDRSQTGLTLLPSPAASAAVRGAIWLVCFGRGDPFLAPGGVVWNDMADAFVPPAPAKRAWRDVGGRREIEATMVSVEGPLVATRGGVSGLRLVMFGHIVPDDATDGAWAADGRPASLVIRLSGLRPEARYAIHVLASGNTTKGGRVEEWSVEGAPGPAGRHGSTGTDGPELTAPLVPTADGTLTLAFRFGAGYGSSGINTLGICEVPAKGEGER
jgi:predicted phosphodiesterase